MKSLLGLGILVSSFGFLTALSFATPVWALAPFQVFPPGESARSSQLFSAAIAFSAGAIAAGWAVGRAGSAGLAGTAERPEIRTTAIIITALGEALAIYGIVIAILILGQTLE